MILYLNGKFSEFDKIKISPYDRGFLFADGVYEAIRTYHKKLFRHEDHLQRLKRSLNAIRINFNETDTLEKIIYKLIEENKIKNEALIYLQITRGAAFPRTHNFPEEKTSPTVFISVQDLNIKKEEHLKGIKVILQEDVRWLRCDIKSISLLPAVLANQKAVEANAGEAIFVRNGLITEGSRTNFFAVKNNTVFTAPLSNLILDGITRKVVLELCKELEINYREEFIKADDLKTYNEFFITSTAKEITPVVQIDNWKVKENSAGKITGLLLQAFHHKVS